MSRKLTRKQQKFADEYIIIGVAEKAALKAGYSKSYSRARANELLANVGIKKYIDERLDEIKSQKVADQQEIMEFLTSIVRGEVREPVPILDGEGTQRVVSLQPNVQARRAAAELLGKRYTMWTEKHQIDGDLDLSVVVDYGDDED
ncbi:terminase small subunit [Salipaludibacillus sp. HK11]|uniref:terminase small subunit n=1 Tax=Salipaludibacillus sp. HK11 TaxID=3394320 RepID=UPI0039FD46B8